MRTSVKTDLSKLFQKSLSSCSTLQKVIGMNNASSSSTASATTALQCINSGRIPFQPVPSQNKTKKTTFLGDYQTPIAMQLGNQIKQSPSDVAKLLGEDILNSSEIIEKFDIINGGVISISLSDKYVKGKIAELFQFSKSNHTTEDKIKAIVDFSSPNMAKRMHVGHLRSTIIGDCICRILEHDGRFKVERMNHVGDFGTQFGMLLAYIERNSINLNILKQLSPSEQLETVEKYYKDSKKLFDSDPSFKELAHSKVIALQQGNDESIHNIWKYLLECSRYEFDSIYERLDIKLTERGESFYKDFIPDTLKHLQPLIKESNGARCIFTTSAEEEKESENQTTTAEPPLMVQKADGGYTYDTTDLATLWYRLFVSKGKWLIYVTDFGQASHFKKVFKVGEMMQWVDPIENSRDVVWSENATSLTSDKKVRIDHVGFGVVLDEEKKKFRTRSGDTVKLHDLLDEAIKRSYDIIKSKNEERCKENEEISSLSEEQLLEASKIVGYGAVKYADLRTNRTTNYIFSFDKMLDFRGNTAVYLLYAYARISSIIEKSGERDLIKQYQDQIVKGDLSLFTNLKESESEWRLALKIIEFKDVLNLVMDKLEPHYLCEYLFDLSNNFSAFFRDCKVIQDDKQLQRSRLLLCEATAQTMKECFNLLGLKTLNRL